jgi:hypothetical protein
LLCGWRGGPITRLHTNIIDALAKFTTNRATHVNILAADRPARASIKHAATASSVATGRATVIVRCTAPPILTALIEKITRLVRTAANAIADIIIWAARSVDAGVVGTTGSGPITRFAGSGTVLNALTIAAMLSRETGSPTSTAVVRVGLLVDAHTTTTALPIGAIALRATGTGTTDTCFPGSAYMPALPTVAEIALGVGTAITTAIRSAT